VEHHAAEEIIREVQTFSQGVLKVSV